MIQSLQSPDAIVKYDIVGLLTFAKVAYAFLPRALFT